MPCTYYSTEDHLNIARAKLDVATRCLCETMKLLDEYSQDWALDISPELRAWRREHLAIDAKRAAQAAADESARLDRERERAARDTILAMLTPEQRRILGVG